MPHIQRQQNTYRLCAVLLLALFAIAGCRDSTQPLATKPSSLLPFWGTGDPPIPSFQAIATRAQPRRKQPQKPYAPPTLPLAHTPHASLPKRSAIPTTPEAKRFADKVATHYKGGRRYRLLVESDKPIYQPGEYVWLRAVVLQQQGNRLPQGKSFGRFKLISPKGRSQTRTVPAYFGHTRARFRLPRSAPGGVHTINVRYPREKAKASIKIMVSQYQPPRFKKTLTFMRKGYDGGEEVVASLSVKRASGEPLRRREVVITARLGGKQVRSWKVTTDDKGNALLRYKLPKSLKATEGLLSVKVNIGGASETIARPIPLRTTSLKVGLFPEGGHALLNQPSRVYFAARQPKGQPQDINAVVKNKSGKVVAKLRSYHDGMGRFVYTPRPGQQYHLHITKPFGIKQTYPLPPPKNVGVGLQLVDDFGSKQKSLNVILSTNNAQTIMLVALQHETIIGQREFKLRRGKQLATLPLTQQWRGIVRLTVFNNKQQPLAERLVFRHKGKGFKIQVKTHRKQYQPRDTVEVKVKVTDPAGKPVSKARLGAVVVDDTVLNYADDHEPNWLAQRYLTQQLLGKIHKPNVYFDSHNRKAPRGLDLLMGTHGWRSFKWNQVTKGRKPPKLRKLMYTGIRPFEKLRWLRAVRKKKRVATAPKDTNTTKQSHKKRRRGGISTGHRSRYVPATDGSSPRRTSVRALGRLTGQRKPFTKTIRGLLGNSLGLKGRIGTSGGGAGRGLSGGGTFGDMYGSGKGWGFGGKRVYGRGGMNLRRRRSRLPRIHVGQPVLRGSLDKYIIRRVVRMHRYQLRYCYERQLRKNPRLNGKIVVRWVIGPTGRVRTATITSSTVGDTSVGGCLVRRIRRWRFPSPGAGIVIVKYPFFFASSGYSIPNRRYRPVLRPVQRTFPVWFYEENNRKSLRKDFRETIFWHPHLVTDAWGEARFRFGLSDNITSFQLRVSGIGKGLLGYHTHQIKSTKPFYLTAKIPMEVSGGDAMVIPVTLNNASQKPLVLALSLSHHRAFKLKENPAPGKVTLAPGQARTFFFPLRVSWRRGKGHLTFVAKGAELSDTLRRTIAIKPRGYPREQQYAARVKAGAPQELRFQLPKSIFALQTLLRLPPSPAQRLTQGIKSMIREPYGCFEQTSSANYPNILALRYLKQQGKASASFVQRTHGMIARGYRKLLKFETKTGGFSLYGRSPGSEVMTAYGLLQFQAIQRHHGGVDKQMLRRTKEWLLARRDGDGGYHHSSGSSGTFGYSSKRVANAYITYALTALGHRSNMALERGATIKQALASSDAYLIALALKMQMLVASKGNGTTRRLRKALLSKQHKDGSFVGKSTIVNSRGRNKRVETTGLAIQALLMSGEYDGATRRAERWLIGQKGFHGGYGATQATLQALRALTERERRYPSARSNGTIRITLNGKLVLKRTLGKHHRRMRFALKQQPRSGKNSLTIQYSGKQSTRISLAMRYRTFKPISSKRATVNVRTKISKQRARMGDIVRLTASLTNTTKKKLPSTMFRIAYPGGLTTQPWQLKALKKKTGASMVETRAREVILYFKTFPPAAKKQVSLDMIARITGNYTGAASSAYEYYNHDHKHWTSPLKISISP